jgi:hypothetical protein
VGTYEDRAPESVRRHARWRRSARRPWKSAVGKDDRNDGTVGLWVTGESVVIARFVTRLPRVFLWY